MSCCNSYGYTNCMMPYSYCNNFPSYSCYPMYSGCGCGCGNNGGFWGNGCGYGSTLGLIALYSLLCR
ncbi:hypothetical protein [Candidatus Arthromitus sp. SFB-rat-Yit]|uniref:hypothetical protein n=1 Tax=Candidatus Arthromitus sp. SFB-rat-Yit TaxID=1041504 RepID=UPI0005C5CC0F|nr:hypothetical protein [Candidatus Arthromitus sp. SFB-rat-Yit]